MGNIELYLGDKLCTCVNIEDESDVRIPADLSGSGYLMIKASEGSKAGAITLACCGKITQYGNALI